MIPRRHETVWLQQVLGGIFVSFLSIFSTFPVAKKYFLYEYTHKKSSKKKMDPAF